MPLLMVWAGRQVLVSVLAEVRSLRLCRDELSEIQERAARQADQLERALDTIATLEARVARGETNPSTTKVLRLKRNPMSTSSSSDPSSESFALSPSRHRSETAVQLLRVRRRQTPTSGTCG